MHSKASRLVIEAYNRGYRVSEDGEVVKPCPDKEGYPTFSLKPSWGGCSTRVYAHRLAAYQEFGEAMFAAGIEVRHLDNNSLSNLALGTRRDNIMDLPKDTRMRVARHAASHRRKLSFDQAEMLRADHKRGVPYSALAAKYGITKCSISLIVN